MAFGVMPEGVSHGIGEVCAISRFNEQIRFHLHNEIDLSPAAEFVGATNYLDARRNAVASAQWRIFSHCASITRLYALYESYAYELVSEWLKALPELFPTYADLPESVYSNHRVGVGILLQKFGGGARTEGITEMGLIEPLYLGLSSNQAYSLLPQAFFIDLRNLKFDELCRLFSKVGMDSLGAWLNGDEDLLAACESVGSTISGRLKDLVEIRNEASHARQGIDQTLGVSAFEQEAEFVRMLCISLHRFVDAAYTNILISLSRVEVLGELTEYFKAPDASILKVSPGVQVCVGDEVFVVGARGPFRTKITSIQVHDADVDQFKAEDIVELGVRFESSIAKVGVRLYRHLSIPSMEVASPIAPPPGGDRDDPVAGLA